jgi:fructose-bisphosphate aldolase class II
MLKDVLKKAQKNHYAIGQFNFSTLGQLRGIISAVGKNPAIIGMSEGELGYLGLEETVALVEISKAKYGVSLFLNLDHGKDIDLIKKVVDYGFSAVHFDGSTLGLEKNIKYAKKIVRYAHKKGVLVEGELNDIKKGNLTTIEDAQKFISETGVDSLAIAIGNVHGYDRNVKLNFERLKELSSLKTFLVLHGGSGISDDQIKKAIKLGIVKINVNTELRLSWKEGLIKSLKSEEIKPYNILPFVQESVQKKVEEKLKLFK